MQVRRAYRAWRRATIAVGLFVLSVLAPAIWREVRLGRESPTATGDVEVVEPQAAEELPSPPRLDAYVAPDLPCEEEFAGIARWANVVRETFASRFGQLFAPGDAADASDDATAAGGDGDLALVVLEAPPPTEEEGLVGATHGEPGEPADTAARRGAIPTALIGQLEPLSSQPLCQTWAKRTTERLQAYAQAGSPAAAEAVLKDLEEQVKALDKLLAQAGEGPLAVPLRRVRHALARRVDVWKAVGAMLAQQTASSSPVSVDGGDLASGFQELSAAVAEAEQFVSASPHGPLWVTFLMLPELRKATSEGTGPDHANRPQQAVELIRLAAARHQQQGLTAQQRRYLQRPPLAQLKNVLLRLIDEPVDAGRLLATLETYEAEGRLSDAEEIAAAIGRLSRSAKPAERHLGDRLAWHYRGTNLRLAVSEEMLNRFLPPQGEPTVQPVIDTILGIPVSGQSLTRNELRFRLLQSHGDVARVQLEALGTVESDTWARSGPVSTTSHTDGQYLVSKLVDLQPDGIHGHPARVEMVNADSQLQSLQSDLDALPLVGDLVRGMAGQRYQSTEPERREEVERKMAWRVERQFERQAEPLLARLDKNFAKRVLVPLGRLELEPEAVIERPADGRLNARIRLAGEHQLSGHTPRPRALVGGLASLQVHESLLNNVLEQLRLEGRTMTAKDLVVHVNRALNVAVKCDAEKADKVSLTFTDRNALRVRLADDRMLLTVSLAKLEAGDRQWTNFQILVPYAIQPLGATVRVKQIEEPTLVGRLSNRSQIIIQGILTNFFDTDANYDLLASVFDARRFGDAHVAQVVIDDGWLGLSLMTR